MTTASHETPTDLATLLAQDEKKDLLRFVSAGSVDDGKSTLIGRLLYESKGIYEDQLESVRHASGKKGSTQEGLDLALVTDGLKAEREQGITIDVAYRYFSTPKRKFIIADTPGHEQYTRNMATGASTANLAIVLIDAKHGVLPQSRRHAFIASLLGIPHLVVAVNKMDLVGFSQERFDAIVAEFREFLTKIQIPDVVFIPISALIGDNVVERSTSMPWYQGTTLLNHLETVHIASDRNLIDLRMPVQYVSRPNPNFRGFMGTPASGVVRPGDAIMVLPSGKTSTVKAVYGPDGEIKEGFPPLPITVTFNTEIDCSRGDVLVHPGNLPRVDQKFEAMVVWMSEKPLVLGDRYVVKHATRLTPAIVSDIRYRMDVNTLHRQQAAKLELNEIGRCVITTARPLVFDAYRSNHTTGSFIIIDRLTHTTVAAGMILEHEGKSDAKTGLAPGLKPHASQITPEEREQRLRQKPATVWISGLTGSGKTAVAYGLERRLFDSGSLATVIDGRNARLGFSSDLSFTPEGRAENLRRAAEVAKMFNHAGLIAVCAFLSPAVKDREAAKQIVGAEHFIEVYLRSGKAAPDADSGLMNTFSDITAAYEPPASPDLNLSLDELSTDAAVDRIVELLHKRGLLG